MGRTTTSLTVAAALTFTVACGGAPTIEIEAARAAHRSVPADAAQLAPKSVEAAQQAQEALEAEIAAQDARWIASHDRTRDLAALARSASLKASADASAERDRVAERAATEAARVRAAAERRTKLDTAAVRVGGSIRPPKKVKDVTPLYPAIARSAKVGGTVQLEVLVAPDGTVADARVIKSVPLLDQAAIDAARQWEYTPTRVKGVAVPVIVNVAVNFEP